MICNSCKQEMTNKATATCAGNTEITFADGVTLPAIPWDDEGFNQNRCGDCGVMPGGFHHPNCDMEYCPRCGRQRIGRCSCPQVFKE